MTASLQSQLLGYTEFFDELLEEVRIEDVLTERVTGGPVRPLRPRARSVRRGWLVAAGAATILVAIIGLVGLFRSTGTDNTPPATDPPQTLEGVAPRLRDSGAIDTVLGNVTWSYYTGPSGPGSSLFEGPEGELAMWLTDEEILWTSSDGAEWHRSRLEVPVDAEVLTARVVGDSYWLSTSNPTTLWRSDDFSSWDEIGLSAIPLPNSFNMDWTVGLTAIAQSESGAVVSWTAAPSLPLEAWYPELANTHSNLHVDVIGHEAGTAYPVRGTRRTDGFDETVTLMRIERFGENGSAWQTYDAEGGGEIAYFAFGTGEHFVDDPFTYSVEGLLLIDDDGKTEAVSPPWSADEGRLSGLVDVGGRLIAAYDQADGAALDLWESHDGRSWDPIGPMPGEGPIAIEAAGSVAYGSIERAESSALWLLREGEDWVRAPTPPGGSALAVRAFGDGYAGWAAGSLWLSLDGTEWVRVDLAALGIGIDTANPVTGFSGNVIGDRLVLRYWPGDQPGGAEPGTQFIVFEIQP